MADTTLLRRLALLGAGALALGACDYGLSLSPDPVAPGGMVTVTNADEGPACLVEDEEGTDEVVAVGAADTPLPVDVFVITEEPTAEPDPVASVMADEEGVFEATFPAPTRPGQHVVAASCFPGLGEEDPVIIRSADHLEPIDSDGIIVDMLRVAQPPLTLSLSDDEVEVGDEVVATFSLCQAENDFGFLEEILGEGGDELAEELAADYPTLAVFVDGVLVDTIETTERYPTGTVDVVLAGLAEGAHEVLGVCTYQTFDFDLETIIEEEGGPILVPIEPLSVGATAVDYPIEEFPFTFDEDTVEAQGTVNVVAAAIAPTTAQPVVAQPTYAG